MEHLLFEYRLSGYVPILRLLAARFSTTYAFTSFRAFDVEKRFLSNGQIRNPCYTYVSLAE